MISEKKLGFGTMRLPLLNPEKAGSIDLEQTKQMVDLFMERGFTYFDTAWMYHSFRSEHAVREALVERYPRESFTLATKLHFGYISTKEDRDKVFEEQRRKCGVDYFDYYLIHAIDGSCYPKYTELDCFSWLQEKKAKGQVKQIGFSYHDGADLLDRVLTEHPEMDFVQLQINYLDWENEGVQSRRCYEVAEKHGIPVIVMEPVKGGTLAQLPQEAEELLAACHPDWSAASWAVRFAASLPNVAVVLSGMSSLEQLDDNTSYMADFQPLQQEEQELIVKAVEAIHRSTVIPCTGCRSCIPGCPMTIPIARMFLAYNNDRRQEGTDRWQSQQDFYERLCKIGKASDCIECGQCESVCPQHLPIINYLKEIAEYWGK